jgi:hypothetical protein
MTSREMYAHLDTVPSLYYMDLPRSIVGLDRMDRARLWLPRASGGPANVAGGHDVDGGRERLVQPCHAG